MFTGDVASMGAAREQVMEFVSEYCSDEGDAIDILVSLQEALINAALHGCGNDPARMIECSVDADPGEIVITVRDPGRGFDLGAVEAANDTVNTSESGRGIALMRGMMDNVEFLRQGSEVRLRKRLRARA